jgi:hypothetical protein
MSQHFLGYSSILPVRRPRPCTSLLLQQIHVQKLQRHGACYSLPSLLACARHAWLRVGKCSDMPHQQLQCVSSKLGGRGCVVIACVTQMSVPYPLQIHPWYQMLLEECRHTVGSFVSMHAMPATDAGQPQNQHIASLPLCQLVLRSQKDQTITKREIKLIVTRIQPNLSRSQTHDYTRRRLPTLLIQCS